ncbi:MAG: outer membrane beta-barrel protein [Ignavibacteria bacterium]|nr:outer membrane beta-barrel protein [Ignavibacteria bacterium]
MYKKINRLIVLALMLMLVSIGYANAQGSNTVSPKLNTVSAKSMYPVFTLSPVAGAIFPMSELGNTFEAGFNGGLDLGIRLNKELGLYTKAGYYSLTNNTQGSPNSSYIEISAGPRYYFMTKKLKSAFFLEGGVGAYVYSQDAYTVGEQTFDRISNTNVGINVGPGFTLQMSKSIDIILKSKYTMVFNDAGTRSFLTALGGLEFKF